MALTDLSFPVTAKKIGPNDVALNPAKVFYLKSADLLRLEPSVRNGNAVLFVKDKVSTNQKVELFETPDEFRAMQALSQGATAAGVFTKHYQNLAPTSSATAGDQSVASKYYNEVNSVNGGSVRLPDPFVRRLVVIDNFTTGSVVVRGRGTTTAINGVTGAAYTIGPAERIHFVAPTAATAGTTAPWRVATDVGA